MQQEKNVALMLPCDHVVTNNFENPTVIKNTKTPNIPNDMLGMDIGKQTVKQYKKAVKFKA